MITVKAIVEWTQWSYVVPEVFSFPLISYRYKSLNVYNSAEVEGSSTMEYAKYYPFPKDLEIEVLF